MADRLHYEAEAAVLSGASLGVLGQGYMRLSYANSIQNIEKALDRLGCFICRIWIAVKQVLDSGIK